MTRLKYSIWFFWGPSLMLVALLLVVQFLVPQHTLVSNSLNHVESGSTTPSEFIDATLVSGLQHSHIQHSGMVSDMIDGLNAGACVADFDNDGWVDLLFSAGGGQTRYYGHKSWWDSHQPAILYRNLAGHFERLTNNGLNLVGSSTACATYDLDDDGLDDILLATTEGLALFKNLGNFQFQANDGVKQILPSGWITNITVTDVNSDGRPDVYLSRFIRYQKNFKNLELSAGFSEQHQHQFGAQSFDGLSNQLLLNQGNMSFVNASKEYALSNLAERSLSSIVVDLDNNGQRELLDFNSGDQPIRSFAINPNNLRLIESNQWPLAINDSHSAATGQQFNDPAGLLLITRGSGIANVGFLLGKDFTSHTDIVWESQLMQQNNVYLNYWGAVVTDFNNDGFADVAMATGGYRPDSFSPQMTQASSNICATQQPGKALMPIFQTHPCHAIIGSSRSAIRLDYNNDGKIDLLFVNNNDFPQLLRNVTEPSGNWLNLTIAQNSPWYEARMTLSSTEHSVEISSPSTGALFGNHDPRIHLGLGSLNEVSLTLKKGTKQLKARLEANHFYVLSGGEWQITDKPSAATTSVNHGADDAASLVRFLIGGAMTEQQQQVVEQIELSASDEQRAELTDLISTYPDAQHLSLYLKWLQTGAYDVQLAAATAIEQLEQEHSVRSLLSVLEIETQNPQLYCRVARIFAHWFNEEEAVTRAKGLAIPYFMRRLDDDSADIVNCTAQTLGYAEHQNAAGAIVDVLNRAPRASQASLVNALGKIRQTDSIAEIHKFLTSSQDVAVLQQSLIALVRLNDATIESRLNDVAQHGDKSHALQLAILALPAANDHIVISEPRRQQWLKFWSAKPAFETLSSVALQVAYLQALNYANLPRPRLISLASEQNPVLQQAALDQLLAESLNIDNYLAISAMTLDKNQLISLQNNMRIALPQFKLDELNAQQISNAMVLLPFWPKTTQIHLTERFLALPQPLLDPIQAQQLRNNLLQHSSLVAPLCLAKMQDANLESYALLGMAATTTMSAVGQSIQAAVEASDSRLVEPWLDLNPTLVASAVGNKISAALLFQTTLDDSVKRRWAVRFLHVDNYSQNWLKAQIQSGNEDSLNAVLSVNGYNWIREVIGTDLILQNASYTEVTKQRLRSFKHLYEVHGNKEFIGSL